MCVPFTREGVAGEGKEMEAGVGLVEQLFNKKGRRGFLGQLCR
uniref:Uncharacterized protein n=1 Tax=Anguilla anguilla TaxID=7936 RepID=A0A0E9RF99_ANGAN